MRDFKVKEGHANIFKEYRKRRDHGKMVARVEVYEDGYIIFETKDKKQEGVTTMIQDILFAMMFLVIGATKRR